jgi:hypothetical protein
MIKSSLLNTGVATQKRAVYFVGKQTINTVFKSSNVNLKQTVRYVSTSGSDEDEDDAQAQSDEQLLWIVIMVVIAVAGLATGYYGTREFDRRIKGKTSK